MKKWFPYIVITLLIPVFTNCYTPRYVYSPIVQNIPVLINKGDSKLALDLSSNLSEKSVFGIDLQAAYAFTKHFAGQASYAHRTERNGGDFNTIYLDSSMISYRRDITEFGLGYFNASGENDQYLFQVFGGVGFGRSGFNDIGKDRNNIYYHRFHTMSVTKIFIQPAFMINDKHLFSATLSSCFNLVYFHNIKTDYTANELDNYKLDSLNYRPRLFWEPAVTNNFGFKKIPGLRIEYQIAMAFLVSRTFVDYRTFNFSIGILVDPPKLLKGRKRTSKN